MKRLTNRVESLERISSGAGKCYIAVQLADGTLVAPNGGRLARHVFAFPESLFEQRDGVWIHREQRPDWLTHSAA